MARKMIGQSARGCKTPLVALCLATIPAYAHAQTTADAPTVRCPDGTDDCLAVPGVAIPLTPGVQPVIVSPPGLWSATASFGLAPRDGGPTGVYESAELRRQIGHAYVQAGAMHYVSPTLSDAVSVSSTFAIGTVAGGAQLGSWLLDGYVSYGWQDFGTVRVPNDNGSGLVTRAANGASGSPYYGAGASIGRIVPLGSRWFMTPTGAVVYAWGRWLHPGNEPGGQDVTIGEATWTGTARLRFDRVMGRSRRSYVGLSLAEVTSTNASSFVGAGGAIAGSGGGAVGPGLGDAGTGTLHLRDSWVEIAGHASLALSGRLRIEASTVRTLGLVTGDTTTISMGLHRQF